MSKHSGRKITLQAHLGNADLNAVFYGSPTSAKDSNPSLTSLTASSSKSQSRKHILNVSTYQMCVLMLFNKRAQWTYEDLKVETAIPDKELQRALMPLSMGKMSQRVLTKDPKAKNIEPTHVFAVNDGFQSKLYKIKITSSKWATLYRRVECQGQMIDNVFAHLTNNIHLHTAHCLMILTSRWSYSRSRYLFRKHVLLLQLWFILRAGATLFVPRCNIINNFFII